MPEDRYITCECGYDIYVPEAKQGSVIECLLCGADNDTAVRLPGERTLSDIPPPRKEAPSPSASPFEGDDDEPVASRPSIAEHQSDQEASPYAASAFEDEDEEDIIDDSPKPDPALIRAYHDPEHSNAYQNVHNAETCPSCGNPFRGDWDKQNVNGKTLCYICSNQATEKIPDRIIQKETVKPNPITENRGWSDSVNVDIPTGPIEEKPWFRDPESKQFKRMVYWLSTGLIVVTLIAVFTTDYSGTPQAPTSIGAEDSTAPLPTLPQWATITYWVLVGCMGFLSQFAGFYVLLALTDRLPNGDFVGDCISIGYCMFWLTIASALYFVTAYYIAPMIMGTVLMMGVSVIFGFTLIVLVINLLDFRIRDFFYLAMINGPVYALISIPASFLYTALAKIAL